MSIYAFAVTAQSAYKGVTERFSNVYHYSFPEIAGNMTVEEAERVLDDLTTIHRNISGTRVTIVEGRAWGPVEQGQAASDTVTIKDYNLTGIGGNDDQFSLDDCYIVRMRTTRQDAKSRPIWLTKYLRLQAGVGGSSLLPAVHARTTKLPQAAIDRLKVYADDIAGVSAGTALDLRPGILCAPSGAPIPADPPRSVDIVDWLGLHEVRY